MSGCLSMMLAVMLLNDPEDVIDVAAAAARSEDADRMEQAVRPPKTEVTSARITSRTSDFDRKEGVVMFEGDVTVRYSADYTMCADRLYMFLAGSNDLRRVVAVGNVSISNETRVGTCVLARYGRKRGEIEMFGNGTNALARLVEGGDAAGALEGSRIKFWLDAEQVEVDDSRIVSDQEGGMKLL